MIFLNSLEARQKRSLKSYLFSNSGGGTWRPSVTPTGSLPRPGSRALGATPTPVTNTSLKATQQPSRAFGSGHNNVAKPFGYVSSFVDPGY